jgi:hypothetical protein
MEETHEERLARWRSVAVSSQAMPTRKADNKAQWDRMKRWDEEHKAAETLVKTGHRDKIKSLSTAPETLKALGG